MKCMGDFRIKKPKINIKDIMEKLGRIYLTEKEKKILRESPSQRITKDITVDVIETLECIVNYLKERDGWW